ITTTASTCSSDGISTISNYNGAETYVFTPAGPTVGAGGVISGMTVSTSYTVTAGNGSCTSAASVSFSNGVMLVTPAVPTISTVAPTCSVAGSSTITNYNGALTYVFTPAGPTVGAGGVISGMTVSTSYTVTAGNGSCTSAASVSFSNGAMLTTPAVPTITTTASTCSSDGISTISNYNGADTYVFTPAGPTVGVGGVISGMTVSTSYTVTAGNGSCTSAASVSFSNGAMLITPAVPTITTTASTCSSDGVSTISNYNGAETYVFTPAGPTVGAGGVISGMTVSTSYTVTAGNGSCTSAASVSFSNGVMLVTPAVPTISTAAPTCSSDGISTITNYDGTLIYVFSPAGPTVDTTGEISGMTVGVSYAVVASNGNCSSAMSIQFDIDPMILPVEVSFTHGCIGGAYTLVASPINASYTYEWLDGAGVSLGTSETQIVTSEGVYTLLVDNGNGCISSHSDNLTTVF
ncbi:T9SS type B sorting domain-containing protein, partial [Flavobacterium pedocola]